MWCKRRTLAIHLQNLSSIRWRKLTTANSLVLADRSHVGRLVKREHMRTKVNYLLGLVFIASMVVGFYPLAFAAFIGAAALNKPIPGRLCASPFQDLPCTVVVSNTYDTHGTITRASFNSLSPTQLEALFKPSGVFAEMDDWFRTSF